MPLSQPNAQLPDTAQSEGQSMQFISSGGNLPGPLNYGWVNIPTNLCNVDMVQYPGNNGFTVVPNSQLMTTWLPHQFTGPVPILLDAAQIHQSHGVQQATNPNPNTGFGQHSNMDLRHASTACPPLVPNPFSRSVNSHIKQVNVTGEDDRRRRQDNQLKRPRQGQGNNLRRQKESFHSTHRTCHPTNKHHEVTQQKIDMATRNGGFKCQRQHMVGQGNQMRQIHSFHDEFSERSNQYLGNKGYKQRGKRAGSNRHYGTRGGRTQISNENIQQNKGREQCINGVHSPLAHQNISSALNKFIDTVVRAGVDLRNNQALRTDNSDTFRSNSYHAYNKHAR